MQENMDEISREPETKDVDLKDIAVQKKTLQPKRSLRHKNWENFANDIIRTLNMHINTMESIEIDHMQLVGIMNDMDKLYLEEKATLALYRTLIDKKILRLETITVTTCNIEKSLERISTITFAVCKRVKNFIDILPYEDDRQIQNERIEDFLNFFKTERDNITGIIVEQLKLAQELRNR